MSNAFPDGLARAEERIAWLERHVTEQDKVMMELVRDLERLRAELALFKARGLAAASGEPGLPVDERPPHY